MNPLFQIIENIKAHILDPIASLIVAVAVFYFIWGAYDFVAGKDNADQVTRGRQHLIYGILGLSLTVGVFGVINFLCSAVGCR